LENPLIAITTKGKRICKKKKKKSVCETSEFGCCFDEKTLAKGPFSAGNIYIKYILCILDQFKAYNIYSPINLYNIAEYLNFPNILFLIFKRF